jgi:hypothetical protein
MSYVTLGSRTAQGAADNSGLNPGNWTIAFTPDVFNVNVNPFEVYKMNVSGAPGSSFSIWIDNFCYEQGVYGYFNTNDLGNVIPLIPGQTMYLCYSDLATDGFMPTATVWMRYEKTTTVQINNASNANTGANIG